MSGSDRKETVTICFLTNHEVDPDEVDLRHKDPEQIRRQLIEAADPCGNIQNVAGDDPDSLAAYREKIREAKHD